jgi:methylated-DNA-[protein]-cysteine S-methyltransferase
MPLASAHLYTPIGLLELRGSDAGLSAVQFVTDSSAAPTPRANVPGCLSEAHRQLEAYFARELRDFQLTYHVEQGTAFQHRVWQVLLGVGFGQTASYLDLARQLGTPGAMRAVGAANGQNPLAIVWPCHRVIGANGQLTGYAGGLPRKRWLLDFERPTTQGSLFT